MERSMTRLGKLLAAFWHYLRDVSGENDYARHCAYELALGHQPLSPKAFYLWKIHQQYSRINRCC